MAIGGIGAAQSGLVAASRRLHASAHNTANVNTEGYKSLQVTNQEAGRPGAGVETRVDRDESPGPALLDEGGTVVGEGSNVSFVGEAVTRITAARAYEANLEALQAEASVGDMLFEVAD